MPGAITGYRKSLSPDFPRKKRRYRAGERRNQTVIKATRPGGYQRENRYRPVGDNRVPRWHFKGAESAARR
jgi:hypothetical protein